MASPVASNSFYSKRESKLAQDIKLKLERAVEDLKKKPLPPDMPVSLLGPSPKWQVFFRQDEALNVAKQLDLMTFAFEERVPGSQGRRQFLVAHPSNMWLKHKARPPVERCTYEVIAQGAPSKLYFDLEFNKTLNPSSDGEVMVQSLIAATLWAFEEIYSRSFTTADVLILDATTSVKFSQHLVFQMADCAFQDNIHAGNFVKFIDSQLRQCKVPGLTEDEQEAMFIKNDKGDATSFCDLGVYTKNRNFRLYLSTKFGKNVPLILAKDNKFQPESSSEEDLFKASLVTYFNDRKEIHLLCHEAEESGQSSSYHQPSDSAPRLNGYQYSPWTEIDRFIESLVAPGFIRQWVYYPKTETIVYDIQGNRYCASIGREHKRNHIKYVVSISSGTYYQSCFDRDCNHNRPVPEPIPQQHLPWNGLFEDEEHSNNN